MTIRVAIDARLPDHGQGGVQQVINTLARGMATLDGGLVERCWLVLDGTSWWKTIIPATDDILLVKAPFGSLSLAIAHRFPGLTSRLFPVVSKFFSGSNPYDELLREHNIDVVHLPFQDGFTTELPYVYNPHDLQHKYLPQFFTRQQIKHRESVWRQRAQNASLVMAASEYVARDLQTFWNIAPHKISIVPIPPPERQEIDDSILAGIPIPFGLYPAAYWPHKNHSNLLRAIAKLKSTGLEIPMVFTGANVGIYSEIRKLIGSLGLDDIIFCLGHVSNAQLTSLLKCAQFVAVPSRFEAMSLVVWDAQKLGTPVTCSNVVPFPSQVGNTALMFDPLNVDEIAREIQKVWSNEELRTHMINTGLMRTSGLTERNYAMTMIGQYLKAIQSAEPIVCQSAHRQLLDAVS